MKSKNAGGVVETIKTVVYAVLIALFVRTVAYEPFNIPSGSMVPTLLIGDYLFVSKFSYGYSRYSFPFGIVPFSGRALSSTPTRGGNRPSSGAAVCSAGRVSSGRWSLPQIRSG